MYVAINLKQLFIICLLVCCSVHGTAQGKTLDSLYRLLAATKEPKARIDITNLISSELRSTNADSAIALAEHTLLLSVKEKYVFGEGSSYICKGLACGVKAQYELAFENAQKAMEIAAKLNNDSLRAYAFLVITSCNFNKGSNDVAIANALEAIKLFEKRNDLPGILRTKNLMSQVYQVKNDLQKAESILKETLLLFPQIKEAKIKINTLHTLANVYGMEGKYSEALALDSQGIQLCDAEKADFLKSSLFDNMANCFMYSNRFGEAKKYFELCIQIDSSFGNKKQMSDTYLNLGNLMMMQKRYGEAEQYLAHSVALADSSGYKQGKYGAWLLLSDLFKANGESDRALAALKKAYAVKDSIINETTEGKIVELETVYQSEKKEQQLKLQKAELTKKNYLVWGLIAGLALLLLSGITFYRKRQLQNKMAMQAEVMNQQNIATRAVITAEENERKRIAADLHDGVGQIMSAAKMNLSAFESELPFKDDSQKQAFEKIISLVDESCKEIRSVSHQMMPNALLKSGLGSAIREFIDKLDSRVLKVNLHTEGLNERLDSNVETVLYRVIQECVNNVIKHSGANTLDISLIKDSDGIAATIEDNGKGFHLSDKEKIEGIGLKNIKSRVQFLKGTVDFDSAPDRGTLVAIHVPLI